MFAETDILRDFERKLDRNKDNMTDFRESEECVRARFSHLFAPEGLDQLKAEDVREFLTYKVNRHWKGINRYSTAITTHMPALRRTIAYAVDESVPLAERVNDALGGEHSIWGLGVASLTPMMWAARPDTYAIYNQLSETAVASCGLLPDASIGERYTVLNDTVARLAREYDLTPYLVDYILPNF
jgi:hypothetical protein